MNIAFFVNHFTERGTEIAIYDYAKYNEECLYNKSYIICFTQETQQQLKAPLERDSYYKFKSRFEIIEINNITDITTLIHQYKLSFFYMLTHGSKNSMFQLENKNIWGNCKTIKHCVFETTYKEGDFYVVISNVVNIRCRTKYAVIPHIVHLPLCDADLRKELNIPSDAIVFGRYGGYHEFNLDIAHSAIQDYIDENEKCYFLFMNTKPFYQHPRILYLAKNVDLVFKTKFINTCDAMIHARKIGETFGLSIAEFSSKNKPVITFKCGYLEHINILKEKAILYQSKEELLHIFKHIKPIIKSKRDWNAYKMFTPNNIMSLFKPIFNSI
jgi:hypothetical protein